MREHVERMLDALRAEVDKAARAVATADPDGATIEHLNHALLDVATTLGLALVACDGVVEVTKDTITDDQIRELMHAANHGEWGYSYGPPPFDKAPTGRRNASTRALAVDCPAFIESRHHIAGHGIVVAYNRWRIYSAINDAAKAYARRRR
jgi:hypothetical protein